jgi:hypothetical protein
VTDNDPLDLVTSMGWEPLPYGCVGIARSRRVGDEQTVWSWLILVPWAVNDSKPWIDGTKVYGLTLASHDEQQADVLQTMRDVLDDRYGESVGQRSVDDFLRKLQDDE